ncbi:uncharacterized protein LOC111387881, partial [Olea europaea var. sylvestris]|uniref:uncharacterized protein LOC111387881 n=1 Tax=Olea europaea var. sylvestris TaxID=158386 RepID=UPI000C1D6A12
GGRLTLVKHVLFKYAYTYLIGYLRTSRGYSSNSFFDLKFYLGRGKCGDVNFWQENRSGLGPLANLVEVVEPDLRLNAVVTSRGWNEDVLSDLIRSDLAKAAIDFVPKLCDGVDTVVWKPSPDGLFGTGSTWKLIRDKHECVDWDKWVWHPLIPKRISFITWKAMQNALVVDEKLQMEGIPLASKCVCCVIPHCKSLNHLLDGSDLAEFLWNQILMTTGITNILSLGWRQRMNFWFSKASKPSQVGMIIGFSPVLIFWVIWTARCRKKMEGVDINYDQIWAPVKWWMGELCANAAKIDGCCIGNPGNCGRGGVIRANNGEFIYAFHTFYGHGINTWVELKAVLEGIHICVERNFPKIIIKSDSQVVVNWFLNKRCTGWIFWKAWEEINDLMIGREVALRHVFREANQVADALSKIGGNISKTTFRDMADLPGAVTNLFISNRNHFPYVRRYL